MQGNNLQKTNLQENVKRATKEGHYVGAHSMTHIYKRLYDNEQFVPEMNETLSLFRISQVECLIWFVHLMVQHQD